MATANELLAAKHDHLLVDADAHYIIDPISREIKVDKEAEKPIIQYDHNSNRITFEIPRMFDGHDTATCNVAQVHYINRDSKAPALVNYGIHEVTDLEINPENEDYVICSWLVSGNATQFAGTLSFSLRLACKPADGSTSYVLNTAMYDSLIVVPCINNADAINCRSEMWTFFLADGTTVTKEVYLG